MNDAVEPRRSGRERKQTESVYADARRAAAAERKKEAANGGGERGNRKRKQGDDSDEESEEENYEDDVSMYSDNEAEDSGASTRTRPKILDREHWWSMTKVSVFHSVDGERVLRSWGHVDWRVKRVLTQAQQSLLADQVQRSITLVRDEFPKSKMTQVPYHADLLPSYEYFAESIKHRNLVESFRISNFYLPPSPWLGESVIPILEKSTRHVKMTVLELSNCGLSADDFSSLTDFLARNETLSTLNVSRNNIESVDTVKAMAKAIKKHPALCNVNLSFCSLGGGNCDGLEKILTACKNCNVLEIGNNDFSSECVASVANFLGKKHSLTAFSLKGATVDSANKKFLTESITKNKSITKLCLHSNSIQLPGIIRNTKKTIKSFCRLTHLDMSFNSLPVQGAKALAKFLENADCALVTLILSKNNLTTKGANALLPALKENSTIKHLDLSRNWLNDGIADAAVELLQNNFTLATFDLSENKSLKAMTNDWEDARRYWRRKVPHHHGARFRMANALFDTTSVDSIANSNHTCAITTMASGKRKNYKDFYEETIRKINSLDVSEPKKIRLKLVLALNCVNKDLIDPRSCDVPLEMMPPLLEMLQQSIGYKGFGKEIAPKDMPEMDAPDRSRYGKWNPLTRECETKADKDNESLNRLYTAIRTSQCLPLLFARGPGKLKESNKDEAAKKRKMAKKKKTKPRKHRRFGDEGDDDDEAFIPNGARRKGYSQYNNETKKWEYIPAPVY